RVFCPWCTSYQGLENRQRRTRAGLPETRIERLGERKSTALCGAVLDYIARLTTDRAAIAAERTGKNGIRRERAGSVGKEAHRIVRARRACAPAVARSWPLRYCLMFSDQISAAPRRFRPSRLERRQFPDQTKNKEVRAMSQPFTLPPLPWADNALEPVISKRTIEFHYGKHHAAYVKHLNGLVAGTDMAGMSLAPIVRAGKGGPAEHGGFTSAGRAGTPP